MPCRDIPRAIAIMALLAACTESPTTPNGAPTAIEVSSGDAQSAPIGALLPAPVRVRVLDQQQQGIAGIAVVFVAEPGGGELLTAVDTTDASGVAESEWRMPPVVGSATARATVAAVGAVTLSATATAAPAARLTFEDGAEIAGTVGVARDTLVSARLADAFGNPIAGATVSFTLDPGSGILDHATATSDGAGRASVRWTIPVAEGEYRLRAAAAGAGTAELVAVSMPAPSQPRLTVGGSFGCLIRDDASLRCWGRNAAGEVGDGTLTTREQPVAVAPGMRWQMVAGRANAACGVTEDAALRCWGSAVPGGANTPSVIPGAPARVQTVGVGSGFRCLLGEDQRIRCWGLNSSGQLGDGSTTRHDVPQPIASTEHFVELAVAPRHACGLSDTGRLFCWGAASIGDGFPGGRSRPVAVAPTLRFGALRVGSAHSCARRLGGSWYCWGSNFSGESTAEPGQPTSLQTPRALSTVSADADLVLGHHLSCAIDGAGLARCWGDNSDGVLGDSLVSERQTPAPIRGDHRFRALAIGAAGCGTTLEGDLRCWGMNAAHAVGIIDSTQVSEPVAVIGTPAFAEVSVGNRLSCGRTEAGEAWCWGRENDPAPVPGGHRFSTIDAGSNAGGSGNGPTACGIAITGETWCWGSLGFLALGSGESEVPVLLGGGHHFETISLGWGWACGIESGQLWCWGRERGTPSADRDLPTHVTSPEPLVAVDIQWTDGCVLGVSGAVYCTLRSRNSTPPTARPINGSPPPFTEVVGSCGLTAAGTYHCWETERFPGTQWSALGDGPCLIGLDGLARCYGENEYGQLGTGAIGGSVPTPALPAGGHGLVAVSVSAFHGCGLDAAGSAWCWGMGRYGELGTGAKWKVQTPRLVLRADGSLP